MLRHIAVVGVAVLLGSQVLAATQAPVEPPEGRANRRAAALDPLSPGQVIAMLDAYALIQAQDALQLSDAQYAAFVASLKKLQETRRRNQQARNQLVRELRRLSAPPGGAQAQREGRPQADEATIRERLKALRELDERAAVELRQAYDALDEVLDVRQQARFRAFEEMLEARKFDLLMRARQAARARGR